MKSILFSCIIFLSFYSCKGKTEKEESQQNYENQLLDDSDYVLNSGFSNRRCQTIWDFP
jgi:hypothetical protein